MEIRDFLPGEEPDIWRLCQLAFKGYPWFEELPDAAIQGRWARHIQSPHFACRIALLEGVLVGASWYHGMSHEDIKIKKGDALHEFVIAHFHNRILIWIDATITHPNFQKRGIATKLKNDVLEQVRTRFPGSVILTRMRDDNTGIILLNERLGFKRTGVRTEATEAKGTFHEFWYKDLSVE